MSKISNYKNLIIFFTFIFLVSCGDNDQTSGISKGHREATKLGNDASNKGLY